jgi:NADH-dependent peroxiredoxin subunit F
MQKIIDEKTKMDLQPILASLVDTVQIVFFTQPTECVACANQRELLQSLCALSDKLKLIVYDFVLNGDEVLKYKVDKTPATAIIGRQDYGIRFYGYTAGHEFDSLLGAILMVSTGRSNLDPQLESLVRAITEPVHLQVMVSLTCQYCPAMVYTAHQFAFVNDRIRADMVEIAEFPHLAQKYGVTSVPKTFINDAHSFEGALPAPAVYLKIIKAVAPGEYTEAERRVRKAQGINRTRIAEEAHEYEVAIIGGGPAGMSAAVYAARKGLDVLLIADKLGGQITYTADIDNYLGLMNISGADMAELFRRHVEKFPIAEALETRVTKIGKTENGFSLFFGTGTRHYKALSVIYCAGKEYQRLGVPGEERFIGNGIGFCATCDAPLYRGKRVAVVGGGNSAFTSVRDLVNFASEVHLISRRTEFKADAPLVEAVRNNKNVVFHAPFEVRAFNGIDKLDTITLGTTGKDETTDLPIDGVFLEIGLAPNNGPLQGLLELDKYGQAQVGRDLSTGVPGLYAAGDITDVEEKQVSIAVGHGALAGISAYKYLMDNKLTKSKTTIKDLWE